MLGIVAATHFNAEDAPYFVRLKITNEPEDGDMCHDEVIYCSGFLVSASYVSITSIYMYIGYFFLCFVDT